MELTFAPNNILQIDDVKVIFRNFSGTKTKYNEEGNRNFAIVIPDERIAQELIDAGWTSVHIKPARNEGDPPFIYMPVKIRTRSDANMVMTPPVYLCSGQNMERLTEMNLSILDRISIESVSLDISPNDWEHGRTAYLRSMKVVQRVDRFTNEYESREELPFN